MPWQGLHLRSPQTQPLTLRMRLLWGQTAHCMHWCHSTCACNTSSGQRRRSWPYQHPNVWRGCPLVMLKKELNGHHASGRALPAWGPSWKRCLLRETHIGCKLGILRCLCPRAHQKQHLAEHQGVPASCSWENPSMVGRLPKWWKMVPPCARHSSTTTARPRGSAPMVPTGVASWFATIEYVEDRHMERPIVAAGPSRVDGARKRRRPPLQGLTRPTQLWRAHQRDWKRRWWLMWCQDPMLHSPRLSCSMGGNASHLTGCSTPLTTSLIQSSSLRFITSSRTSIFCLQRWIALPNPGQERFQSHFQTVVQDLAHWERMHSLKASHPSVTGIGSGLRPTTRPATSS